MATESNTDNTIVRSRYCGLRDVYAAVITQNNATGYVTETPVSGRRKKYIRTMALRRTRPRTKELTLNLKLILWRRRIELCYADINMRMVSSLKIKMIFHRKWHSDIEQREETGNMNLCGCSAEHLVRDLKMNIIRRKENLTQKHRL